MKPQIKLATARTSDGGVMELFQHDRDFSIKINGLELMNSRQHDSEEELARLGCAHLSSRQAACVLIGGLGLGYTLRKALEILNSDATVVVSELMPDVVDWNRGYLKELNGQALDDPRTNLIVGDIFPLLSQSIGKFDAILLDVDNGPHAMTDSGNQRLYSPAGMYACRCALRQQGVLAIWSTEPSHAFEEILTGCGFQVRRYRAKSYPGSTSRPVFIWVAAEDESVLPVGSDEPESPKTRTPAKNRRARR